MKMVKSVMNTRYAEKRTRSANDPVMSAGVITANFAVSSQAVSPESTGPPGSVGGASGAKTATSASSTRIRKGIALLVFMSVIAYLLNRKRPPLVGGQISGMVSRLFRR